MGRQVFGTGKQTCLCPQVPTGGSDRRPQRSGGGGGGGVSQGDAGTSSAESTTEGDSSRQSQRSVVYLHAATGTPPPPPQQAAAGLTTCTKALDIPSSTIRHFESQSDNTLVCFAWCSEVNQPTVCDFIVSQCEMAGCESPNCSNNSRNGR